MNGLRDWLLGITAAALAVALAQALTPEGTVKKVGRLVGGLVLLLAVFRPFMGTELDTTGNFSLPSEISGSEDSVQSGTTVLKLLIGQKAGAYIVDKGASLGVRCQAEVGVAPDDSGWYVPWEVTVTGEWTADQKKLLSQAMEDELGIPAVRQSFREEGI